MNDLFPDGHLVLIANLLHGKRLAMHFLSRRHPFAVIPQIGAYQGFMIAVRFDTDLDALRKSFREPIDFAISLGESNGQ